MSGAARAAQRASEARVALAAAREQAVAAREQREQAAAAVAAVAAPPAVADAGADANPPQAEVAPAPPAEQAPAPAAGRPVALVVDPKNPRTPKEDTDRLYQWIGRPREFSFEEMVHWTKANFSFSCKDVGGWHWFRKAWHSVDTRIDSRNPRNISEDHNHIYQWAVNPSSVDPDGWNYCGVDRDGQRWFRRPWPEPDANNPRRPEDDKMLKFCWSVLAGSGDNMEMIRNDWEYVGKASQGGSNLWRKRRRVVGVLPPDAADPEARHEVEDARSARRRRLGPYLADRDGRHDAADDLEERRQERQAVVPPIDEDDEDAE